MTYSNLPFGAILDDLCCRFIINIPSDELQSVQRVGFQVELCHWFYEDFVRQECPSLKSYSLKHFSKMLFGHCPLLTHWVAAHDQLFNQFQQYKTRVPVCGAIIMNNTLDKVLLVRGWRSNASWGFPKGKINKDELVTSCAIREVYEEIGFDISPYIRQNEYLERFISDQKIRLYIIAGIPEDTLFQTRTRKEIGAINWFPLNAIPGYQQSKKDPPLKKEIASRNYFLVTPFISALQNWIRRFKKARKMGIDRNKTLLKVVMGVASNTESDGDALLSEQSTYRTTTTNNTVVNEFASQYEISQTDVTFLEASLRNTLGLLSSSVAHVKPTETESESTSESVAQDLMTLLGVPAKSPVGDTPPLPPVPPSHHILDVADEEQSHPSPEPASIPKPVMFMHGRTANSSLDASNHVHSHLLAAMTSKNIQKEKKSLVSPGGTTSNNSLDLLSILKGKVSSPLMQPKKMPNQLLISFDNAPSDGLAGNCSSEYLISSPPASQVPQPSLLLAMTPSNRSNASSVQSDALASSISGNIAMSKTNSNDKQALMNLLLGGSLK